MNTHTFINRVRSQSLLPTAVKDTLINLAENFSEKDRKEILKKIKRHNKNEARIFAKGAKKINQAVRGLRKVQRATAEKAERKNLPSF